MSEIFQSIGSFLSGGLGKGLLQGGTAGVGLLQNLLSNRQAEQKQKFVEGLVTDPTKWAKYVAGFDKPLSSGLTADISRMTDAYGAERGLGSSPAIMKDVYAQALAPYVQNEQQMAQNAALQSLGIYENSPTTKPMDITSLLKLFMTPGGPAGASPINVPGGTTPTTPGGGYGGWVGPIQDAPTGDSGIYGTVPGTPGTFDPSSLVDMGAFA